MKTQLIITTLLLSLICPVLAKKPAATSAVANDKPSTIMPVPSQLKKFMPKRHNEKLAEAKQGEFDLVMIGDSITHNWESQKDYAATFTGIRMLNLGFAGDRTQNVLWRIEHGALGWHFA